VDKLFPIKIALVILLQVAVASENMQGDDTDPCPSQFGTGTTLLECLEDRSDCPDGCEQKAGLSGAVEDPDTGKWSCVRHCEEDDETATELEDDYDASLFDEEEDLEME